MLHHQITLQRESPYSNYYKCDINLPKMSCKQQTDLSSAMSIYGGYSVQFLWGVKFGN